MRHLLPIATALLLIGAAALRVTALRRERAAEGSAGSYLIERAQTIEAPLEEAFRFFEDPHNLTRITPPWVDFEILDVQGVPLARGTRIEYRIRWLRFPQRWSAEITEYEPGRRFVDVQRRGPYRHWRHEHTFEERDGRTLMRDRVEYALPFGVIGRVAHALVVQRQLRQIFDYREAAIRGVFSGPEGVA